MLKRFILNVKQHSRHLLNSWCDKYETIFDPRSRRFEKMYRFYKEVPGIPRLKSIVMSYLKFLHLPLLIILLSEQVYTGEVYSIGSFNWGNERLSLANFDSCQKDIDFIEGLPRNKLCKKCRKLNMRYCYCNIGNKTCKKDGVITKKNCSKRYELKGEAAGKALIHVAEENSWEPYISKQNFLIWKRQEKTDMYSYKVYARFNDITAADLLHVQTDLDYRKQWDNTAVRLEIVEADPAPGSNSHVIYWEMLWPKLFLNRDYVYCRRYVWDDTRKVILICSSGANHPAYPRRSDKVRVTKYWSLMVIKPFRDFHQPGVHYVLTYFDDPGVPIPRNLKAWVTQKQMPEFLRKMYEATKEYASRDAIDTSHIFSTFDFL